MVKITNLHDEEKPETINPPEEETIKELTPQEIKNITETHRKDLNPYSITSDETKTEKINTRITKTILNTLKVYSELNNTTVSQFIEELISNFFEGKKINRDYYPIKETVITIPLTPELIRQYINSNTNLIVDTSKITIKYPINPYDKQYSIFMSSDPLLSLTYINVTNNYLDKLDHEHKLYYKNVDPIQSGLFFDELKEELTPKEELFKNHLGLVIFPLSTIMEYDSVTLKYKEKKLDKPYCLYLLMYEKENILTKVQLITKKQAVGIALDVENVELLEHINNSEDITNFMPIKEKNDILSEYIIKNYELEQEITKLKEENRELKEYKKSKAIFNKEEEKINVPLEPETIVTFLEENVDFINRKEKELNTITELLQKYYKDISKDKNKYEKILEEIHKK